jgi:membrane fusion protein
MQVVEPVLPSSGQLPPDNALRLSHTIDLRQNRVVQFAGMLSAAVIGTLIAGLWFGQFSKTETTRGLVASSRGFSRLDAPKAGFIKQIYVNQGDHVDAGTPVYLLGLGEANSGGDSAVAAEIKALTQSRADHQSEIDRAAAFVAKAREQAGAMERDEKDLNAALDSQEKSVQQALTQASQKLQRIKQLVREGYATRDIEDSYQRSYFDYERQVTEIKVKRVEYKRQSADKQRELFGLLADKQTQINNAKIAINSIDARIGRLKTESALEVQAQSPGRVLAVTGKVGDSVEAGQFIAAVGDDNAEPLIVLDAPARATGLVKVGQKVVLKYDAFPFKTFGIQHGVVTSISSSAVRAPATEGDRGLDPRPVTRQSLYRIEVRPDSDEIEAYGERKKITIGSTLSADIIIEKRRLIDWVLDPIRAMQGRT